MPDTPPTPSPEAPDLDLKLRQTEALLAEAKGALAASERRRQVDRELAGSGVIDQDAAAILLEPILAQTPDIPAAIADLKRLRPYLFAAPPRPSATMAAATTPTAPLDQAAHTARATGDRRALLSYLRLRRGT